MPAARGGLPCKLMSAPVKARASRSPRPGLGGGKTPKQHQPSTRLDLIDQHPPPTAIRAPRPVVHQSRSESIIKELKHSPISQPIPSRTAHSSNPPGRYVSNPTFDPDSAFDRLLLRQRCTSPVSPAHAPPECAAGQLCVRERGRRKVKSIAIPRRDHSRLQRHCADRSPWPTCTRGPSPVIITLGRWHRQAAPIIEGPGGARPFRPSPCRHHQPTPCGVVVPRHQGAGC